MINGVLLDFNGTLFQDTQYHVEAFDRLTRELFNRGISEAEFLQNCAGVPNDGILRYLSHDTLNAEERQMYSLRKEAYYREAVRNASPRAQLTAGSEELFDHLVHMHIPFTIVSASIRENIDFFVEWFSLAKWFDPGRIIYDNGTYTTKTQMFRDACTLLGCTHPLVIEDSLSGIRCAVEISAPVIVIESGISDRIAAEEVTAIVKDMKPVPEIIRRLL